MKIIEIQMIQVNNVTFHSNLNSFSISNTTPPISSQSPHMTSVQTIFSQQLDAKTPILALLLLILSIALYHSLYPYLLRKYLQELFFATKHFKSFTNRTIVYVLIISLPMITLSFISIFYNNSLLGPQTSMTIDELNIMIVAGYICWVEESRHTPLRGMHLIRDVLFAILLIGLYVNSFASGSFELDESIIALVVSFIYYLVLMFFQPIQNLILRILGLKQSNSYNSKFLLTSKYNIPDFLQIKDLISQKKDIMDQQLNDYKEILANLQQNQEDQQILMNFAKLFLPIKKACELKQLADNRQALEEIQTAWQQGSIASSDDQDHQEQPIHNAHTFNSSSDGLGLYGKTTTFTDDFIKEEEQYDYEMSFYEKVIKYAFYPVYLGSFAEGRLFYLVGYVALLLMVGLMFGISNSAVYFSQLINGYSIVSIVIALSLIYPSAKYCLKISINNDYDFTNIFLQSMILKLAVTSVFFIIYNSFFSSTFQIKKGEFINLVSRIILLTMYLVFMAMNRFATRFNNFKFFVGFLVVVWTGEVIAENVYNSAG